MVRDDGVFKVYIEEIYFVILDFELLLNIVLCVKEKGYRIYIGKVRSYDSFYIDREDEIDKYWLLKGILGVDMEIVVLFIIGGFCGVKIVLIFNIVVIYKDDFSS